MKSTSSDKKVSFRCKPSLMSVAVRSSIFVLGLAHASAHAANITVTSASDNGIGCTLREAISSANNPVNQGNGCAAGSDTGVDQILFDSTEFATATSIELSNGQLDLQNKNIEINAQSVTGGVTVVADSASRVMQISGGEVSLNNLTITGGRAVENGGGLLINGGAVVTLTDSQVIDNNVVESGAGIHLDGGSMLNLQSSKVTNNRTVGNRPTSGGAIYAGNGNTVELRDSEISENTVRNVSGAIGAGLYARDNNTVVVINSRFVDNSSDSAISIRGDSSLDLIDSVIQNNSTRLSAAVELAGLGVVNIIRSRISDNIAGRSISGLEVIGNTTTVVDSVISNNSADGYLGGGFYFQSGSITVTNTTISNNTVTFDQRSYGAGGAIGVEADVTFNHVTMSDNNIYSNRSFGTSLFVLGSLNLQNSIIANSVGPADTICFDPLGLVTIDSATIIEDGSCGALRNGDPGLLPLADNGGPTLTNALSANSIAINTGDTSTCLQTDQRGAERDVLCDVGAFEFGADVPIDEPEPEPNNSQTFVIPLPNGKSVIFEL